MMALEKQQFTLPQFENKQLRWIIDANQQV